MNTECEHSANLRLQAADQELSGDETAWLKEHEVKCAACRMAQQQFLKLDRELAAWGDWLERGHTAQPGAHVVTRRRPIWHWVPALCAAAGLVVTSVALLQPSRPQRGAVVPASEPSRPNFVPIPYVPPLEPYESARVMQMEIPVAALLAVGYSVQTDDPAQTVTAEVLVGEDGRAHAVRLLSNTSLN